MTPELGQGGRGREGGGGREGREAGGGTEVRGRLPPSGPVTLIGFLCPQSNQPFPFKRTTSCFLYHS